jgi:hypothetical protein
MDAPGTVKALDTKDCPDTREVIVEVRLNASGDPEVSEEYFYVSKSKNEEVRWVCAQEHDCSKNRPCFSVEFKNNDSPFYEYQFSSDAPVSGLVRRNVLPSNQIYKYTVRIGEKSSDPGGGVKQ